jgi:hypothetical protein
MTTFFGLALGLAMFGIVAAPLGAGKFILWRRYKDAERSALAAVRPSGQAFFTRGNIPVVRGIGLIVDPLTTAAFGLSRSLRRGPTSRTSATLIATPGHAQPAAEAEATTELAEVHEETDAERAFWADPLGSWSYPPEEDGPHFLPEADGTFNRLVEAGWGEWAARDIDVEWEAWNLYQAEAVPA